MGWRTVVILNNDRWGEWSKDPKLGDKISQAHPDIDGYGRVIESAHCDQLTLGVIDGLKFRPLAYDTWTRNQSDTDANLKMLKQAAEKMGYRLVRKNKKG